MNALWGCTVVILSLLCWGGQVVSWLLPDRAAKWGLIEPQHDVEPVYWADVRGEAAWDSATLWTMAVAGGLLVAGSSAWPYFGLVGGGMYLYFAGRGIVTRVEMQRRHFRIGASRNVRLAYAFLTIWGLMAAITVTAAVVALP